MTVKTQMCYLSVTVGGSGERPGFYDGSLIGIKVASCCEGHSAAGTVTGSRFMFTAGLRPAATCGDET